MSTRQDISGEEIENWAERYGADADLPKLIRRLLLATTPLDAMEMRADAGVRLGGWDGVVNSDAKTPFCPAGISVWELTTDSNIKRKLDNDWAKRTVEATKQATYVAVVARRFASKNRWSQDKKALERWGDVRLLDADDLATWLEQAPAVGLWFADLLGRRAYDCTDIKTFVEAWRQRTVPPLPWELALAGRERESQAQELLAALSAPQPRRFSVHGEDAEEALLFVAAAIMRASLPERWLSRALVVESEEAYRWALRAQRSGGPLIVLASLPGADPGQAAISNAHVVFGRASGDPPAPGISIALARIRPGELAEALKGRDREEREAQDLARKAKGSLRALQTLCGYVKLPEWATGFPRADVTAFLLAGAWIPTNSADRAAITQLGGEPSGVEQLCQDLTQRRVVNRVESRSGAFAFQWASADAVWKLLARALTEADLSKLEKAVVEVLGVQDPRYELPKEERFAAALKGKVLPHSAELRNGLVYTLAMLAHQSRELSDRLGASRGAAVATRLIWQLLEPERGWLAWASLPDLLPDLAEVAPEAFLHAVEGSLDQGERGVAHLFEEESRMGTTPHVPLLWALDRLGFSPDFSMVQRVALSLARLSFFDRNGKQPGRVSNRPIQSLMALLHPLLSQSNATIDERLQIVSTLFRRDPESEVARQLSLRIIQSTGDIVFWQGADRPKLLPWPIPNEKSTIKKEEWDEWQSKVVDLLLSNAGDNAQKWAEFIQTARRLPEPLHERVCNALASVKGRVTDAEGSIYAALRERLFLLSRRRIHEDGKVGPPETPSKEHELLDALYRAFTPTDFVARSAWLFEPRADLPEPIDFKEEYQRLTERRDQALEELSRLPNRWTALVDLIAAVKEPFHLAARLADAPFADELEERLLCGLPEAAYDPIVPIFGAVRAARKTDADRVALFRKLVALGRETDIARIARHISLDAGFWGLIDSLGDSVRLAYWSNLNSPLDLGSAEEVERAIDNWLEAGNALAALKMVSYKADFVSSETALRVLEQVHAWLARGHRPTEGETISYDIERAFLVIDREPSIKPERVLPLELAFLSVLTESERGLPHLSRTLGDRPDEFVRLIGMMYRRKGESDLPEGEEREVQRKQGEGAYRILHAWTRYPGEGLSDEEREARLEAWSKYVLDKTHEEGRGAPGTARVAEVLARAPTGADGHWPCVAARKLLESGAYPDLADDLRTADYNRRNAEFRAVTAIVEEERELSERYRASTEALRDDYPRTAVFLDDMARANEASANLHERRLNTEVEEDGGSDDDEPQRRARRNLYKAAENAAVPKSGPGPLTEFEAHRVGPAPSLRLEFAPSLNLLIGDNGLGKTFVLEVLWWAHTGSWNGEMARPFQAGKASKTKPKDEAAKEIPRAPSIRVKTPSRTLSASYEARRERWSISGNYPLGCGLVVYAPTNGGFLAWDPIRNQAPANPGEQDLSVGYHLSQKELWHGLLAHDGVTPLCKGLIDDAVRWRSERPQTYRLLETALKALSPPDGPIELGRPRRFSKQDDRDHPTLVLPYGSIFAVHASAAVKRILGLAYVLVWTVSSLREAADVAEAESLRQVTLLIDEVEAHLHPKWQRTILPSLFAVVEQMAPDADVQIIASTHSPLVLASVEPRFDPKTAALFEFSLDAKSGRRVEVGKETWQIHGDANVWLGKMGLDEPRSIESEKAIKEASKAMKTPKFSRKRAKEIDAELRSVLSDIDPFWIRWRYMAERKGWLK